MGLFEFLHDALRLAWLLVPSNTMTTKIIKIRDANIHKTQNETLVSGYNLLQIRTRSLALENTVHMIMLFVYELWAIYLLNESVLAIQYRYIV